MSDEQRYEDIAVAEDLTKHFKSGPVTVKAVDGVSFRLPKGKIVALRGPSGCGKSTLLNLIGALDRPDSGPLNVDGVDVTEAFAAPSLPCIRELEIDPARVNPNGGAIALGHPLGCSGARITTTLLHEMKRRGAKHGLATMCVGVGQGAATLFAGA